MIYQNEIASYEDLQRYIKQQLGVQTAGGKRRAEIKLNGIWFYKLHKLIRFSLKYSMKEEELHLPQEDKRYWVKINGITVLIERYDIQRKEDN